MKISEKTVNLAKRQIELEEWLESHNPKEKGLKSFAELYFYFNLLGFDEQDIDYLIRANTISKKEIEDALDRYQNDNGKKAQENILVNNLALKYNVERIVVIKRIEDIRRIKKYIKSINDYTLSSNISNSYKVRNRTKKKKY